MCVPPPPPHFATMLQVGSLSQLYGTPRGLKAARFGGGRTRGTWSDRPVAYTWWDAASAVGPPPLAPEQHLHADPPQQQRPRPPSHRPRKPRFRNTALEYRESVLKERVALTVIDIPRQIVLVASFSFPGVHLFY